MKLDVLNYDKKHLDFFEVQAKQRWVLKEHADALDTIVERGGIVKTFADNDKLVALAGALPSGPVRVDVLTIMSVHFREYAIPLFRQVTDWLNYLHEEGYDDIHTSVGKNFPEADRWCRLLGFEPYDAKTVLDQEVLLYRRTKWV